MYTPLPDYFHPRIVADIPDSFHLTLTVIRETDALPFS
jgi:hypothetical protein